MFGRLARARLVTAVAGLAMALTACKSGGGY